MKQGRDLPGNWRLVAPHWGRPITRRRDANGGKVVGVILWCEDIGEAEVLLARRWERLDEIEQLDALCDCIGLLEREFNARLGCEEDEP